MFNKTDDCGVDTNANWTLYRAQKRLIRTGLPLVFAGVLTILAGCNSDPFDDDHNANGSEDVANQTTIDTGPDNQSSDTGPDNQSSNADTDPSIDDAGSTEPDSDSLDATDTSPTADALADVADTQPDADTLSDTATDTPPTGDTDANGGGDADDDAGSPECTYNTDPNCPLDCAFAEQWDSHWLDVATDVIDLINDARTQGASCEGQSLPPTDPLPIHAALDEASRCHSLDMATEDAIAINGSDGSTGRDRADDAGYPEGTVWVTAHGWHETSHEVVASWIDNFCTTLLEPDWEHIGAAVVIDDTGEESPYWTLKLGVTAN